MMRGYGYIILKVEEDVCNWSHSGPQLSADLSSFFPLIEQFTAGNNAMAVMTSAGRHSRRCYLLRKEGLPDGHY